MCGNDGRPKVKKAMNIVTQKKLPLHRDIERRGKTAEHINGHSDTKLIDSTLRH